MTDPTETLEITWQDIDVSVSVCHNFLNTGYHHIELRADQPLPVSLTGYRSLFMPMDQFNAFASLEQLVRLWLNDAAKSKEWIKAEEERRQLKLF